MGTAALRRAPSGERLCAVVPKDAAQQRQRCDKRTRAPWSACNGYKGPFCYDVRSNRPRHSTVAASSAYEVRGNESEMEKLHVGFTVWYVFSLQDKIRFALSNFSFIFIFFMTFSCFFVLFRTHHFRWVCLWGNLGGYNLGGCMEEIGGGNIGGIIGVNNSI